MIPAPTTDITNKTEAEVNDIINDLCRKAARLAPVVAEEAMSATPYTRDDLRDDWVSTLGPRQLKAVDMVCEAYRLNSAFYNNLDY